MATAWQRMAARSCLLCLWQYMRTTKDSVLDRMQAPHRFGISRSLSNKRPPQESGGIDAVTADFQSKLLHLAWHPEDNVIAGAASNSLYMFIGK